MSEEMKRGVALATPLPYYSRNGITLYNADYREVAPLLADNSLGAIVSDPPYATTALEWDKAINWPEFWEHAHRLCPATAPIVLFASGSFVPKLIQSNPKNFRYDLIWAKPGVTGFLDAKRRPLRAHEKVLVFLIQFHGSTYNPQMIEGKPHSRGKPGPPAAHYSQVKRTPMAKTNLYYPRDVLHFGLERRPDGRRRASKRSNVPLAKSLAVSNNDNSKTDAPIKLKQEARQLYSESTGFLRASQNVYPVRASHGPLRCSRNKC
jgi:hypothetical protein